MPLSPALVTPRAKRRHLSKLGTVIRANGAKKPHSARPPECAAQGRQAGLKKICINPGPHGVHVAVPDPAIVRVPRHLDMSQYDLPALPP